MFRSILVALDGSRPSLHALDVAADMAKGMGAELILVGVAPLHAIYPGELVPTAVIDPGVVTAYRDMLVKAKARAEAGGAAKVRTVLKEGIAADEVLACAQEVHPDLIVVGSRGLSASRRLLLGSVSTAVVHEARVPTLVIPDAGAGSPP